MVPMSEMREKEDAIKQLIHCLQITRQQRDDARFEVQMIRQQRDEARSQMQMLLSNTYYNHPVEPSPMISIQQPDTPPTAPTLLNYSFTDSDGLSSSPDVLLDSDSVINQQQLTHSVIPNQPTCSIFLDQFVPTKPLPENGRFLQAVMDAGPLLKSLLMAESLLDLPRWRNPPPLHPLAVGGFDGDVIDDHLNYVGVGQIYDGILNHQQQ